MPEKNTADSIQAVLEKNGGCMTVNMLAFFMDSEICRELGIKKTDTAKMIRRKIEKVSEDRFIFRTKGKSIYALIPCEPSEFVMSLIPKRKAFDMKILHRLPFTKSEFIRIINGLAEEGRVRISLSDDFTPRIYRAENERITAENPVYIRGGSEHGEFTREKFREAFRKSDKGRSFVRIFKMRRYLRWPRDVFDEMIMTLLREGKIFVHPAEPTVLKPDEWEDSFRDEFGDMNGTVTWNE